MLLALQLLALSLSLTLSRAAVLVDFQVAQPPPLPKNAQTCTIEILQRTFGNSYGDPEIVQYTPPTNCGPVGSWAGISLNFTVTSNGTQYDRLGTFTFQNVEIWRTSTPEPTPSGIIWTYVKDVTRYIPLFSKQGSFILELDNIVETGLNGEYATTLYATFYASSAQYPAAPQANTIIPVTTLSNTNSNVASVPPAFSLNVTVPQNAVQIYAELYASGNGDEEFWYYNAANEYLDDLDDETYGNGPFREVRLLVDSQVAGVAFPYPVVFTGGIAPTAWQPITSYGALDLPTYFVDLTPFVPILTDGNPHNISIDVASAETNHSINGNWFVSGSLQVITDPSPNRTTGKITKYDVQPYAQTSTTGNTTSGVVITVAANRSVHIEAEIVSGSGVVTNVVWSQQLEYSNTQYWSADFNTQNVVQTASGSFLSTHNGVSSLVDQFSYPFNVNLSIVDDGTVLHVLVDHSYQRTSQPSPFILGSTINEHQVAYGIWNEGSSSPDGTNNNTFSYSDLQGNTYSRNVNASAGSIAFDQESGTLAPYSYSTVPAFFPLNPFTMPKPRLPGARKIGS
ncbi:peptide N-acetyl-beta-D-glucosaminyl asparaginase amidase A-domain-containing protein [Amylocystis lapponica]|nr:peptide N-acetyl-beta-D-glucosaminyl asparaginase amidase A-domain-containing protein [Amylocystis lapponica]